MLSKSRWIGEAGCPLAPYSPMNHGTACLHNPARLREHAGVGREGPHFLGRSLFPVPDRIFQDRFRVEFRHVQPRGEEVGRYDCSCWCQDRDLARVLSQHRAVAVARRFGTQGRGCGGSMEGISFSCGGCLLWGETVVCSPTDCCWQCNFGTECPSQHGSHGRDQAQSKGNKCAEPVESRCGHMSYPQRSGHRNEAETRRVKKLERCRIHFLTCPLQHSRMRAVFSFKRMPEESFRSSQQGATGR